MKARFDLQTELDKALTWVLEEMKSTYDLDRSSNLPGCHGRTWLSGRSHFSATDLERRLRGASAEVLNGLPYGSQGIDTCYPVRVSTGGRRTLLEVCRNFLAFAVRDGELRADQPSGKQTCSGLRFRPADQPLTEAEVRSKASIEQRRARGTIRHLRGADGRPACMANMPKRRAVGWGRRKHTWYVGEHCPEPTCKRCLALAAKTEAAS